MKDYILHMLGRERKQGKYHDEEEKRRGMNKPL